MVIQIYLKKMMERLLTCIDYLQIPAQIGGNSKKNSYFKCENVYGISG